MEGRLIVLSILLYHVNGWIPFSKIMHVTKGESYRLSCGINYEDTFDSCYIQNPLGRRMNYPQNPEWEKRRVKFLDNSTMCGLEINDAIEDDEGSWKCVVTLQGNVLSTEDDTSRENFTETTRIGVVVKVPIIFLESTGLSSEENVTFHSNSLLSTAPVNEAVNTMSNEPQLYDIKDGANSPRNNISKKNLNTAGDENNYKGVTEKTSVLWVICIIFISAVFLALVVSKAIKEFSKK